MKKQRSFKTFANAHVRNTSRKRKSLKVMKTSGGITNTNDLKG